MIVSSIVSSVKRAAAALTDGLAHVGGRMAAVTVTLGPATATIYPHVPQTPPTPEQPKTCPHCGGVK